MPRHGVKRFVSSLVRVVRQSNVSELKWMSGAIEAGMPTLYDLHCEDLEMSGRLMGTLPIRTFLSQQGLKSTPTVRLFGAYGYCHD